MKIVSVISKLLVFFTFAIILISCGGGGGGDDSGAYSISTTSVSFNVVENGSRPADQYVDVSVNSGIVFVDVQENIPSVSVNFDVTGDTTGRITVRLTSTAIAPGNYNGTITVRGCADPACNTQVDGSPKIINVAYTITPQQLLSASPASINLVSTEGIAPATATSNLSVNYGDIPNWTVSVTYSGNTFNWLTLTPDMINNTLTIDAAPLAAGNYQATIVIRNDVNPSILTIPVNYTANPAVSLSATSIDFNAVEGTLPDMQSIMVTPTGQSFVWNSINIDYNSGTNWLTAQQNGNALEIRPSLISTGSYSAEVQILYTTGSINGIARVSVSYSVATGVTSSVSDVNITSIEGEIPAIIPISLSNLGTGLISWTSSIDYTSGTNWISLDKTSGTSIPDLFNMTLTLAAPGSYSATLNINYNYGGIVNQLSIPVSYQVNDGISLTLTNLTVNAIEGENPAVIPVGINYTGTGDISWQLSVGYQQGSNWMDLSSSSGTSLPVSVNFDPLPLSAGSYNAIVTLSYQYGSISGTKTLPISYNLASAWNLTNTLSFNVNLTTPTSELSQILIINDTFTAPTSTLNWSATVSTDNSIDWLQISPNSGDSDTSNQLTVDLIPIEVSKLSVGTHNATITLTPQNPAVSPYQVDVSLVINLPTINYASPYIAKPNISDSVIIRGTGFNQITNENILFGSNQALSLNVISDTEMVATYPALTSGSYRIVVDSTTDIGFSSADLVVVNPLLVIENSLPVLNGFQFYDSERELLYMLNGNQLVAYAYSGNTWIIVDSLTLNGIVGAELAPNGRTIIAVTPETVVLIDANTLQITDTINVRADLTQYWDLNGTIIATNAGVLFLTVDDMTAPVGYARMVSFDLVNQMMLPMGFLNRGPRYYSTLNGAFMYIDYNGIVDSKYLASSHTIENYFFDFNGVQPMTVSLSKDASAVLVHYKTGAPLPGPSATQQHYFGLFDQNQNQLGQFPVLTTGWTPSGTPMSGQLSTDGTRAYLYQEDINTIRVFDLTNVDANGDYVELANSIALSTVPGGTLIDMWISPDDSILFIQGSNNLVIIPLP